MLWLEIGPQNGATIVTRMTNVAILKYLEMAALILSHYSFTSIYHTCHLPTTHGFSLVALRWGNRRAAFGSRMLSCDVWPSRTRINSRAKRFKESTSVTGWEIGHLQVCETGTNAFVACSKKMQTSCAHKVLTTFNIHQQSWTTSLTVSHLHVSPCISPWPTLALILKRPRGSTTTSSRTCEAQQKQKLEQN